MGIVVIDLLVAKGRVINGVKFRILYYKQCLDKRCGVQKNLVLDDGCIWDEVGVMCAL